jgi:cytochrome c553
VGHFVLFLFCFIFCPEQSLANSLKGIEITLHNCASCHGKDGNAALNQAMPKLAGQNIAYLITALKGFKPGSKSGHTDLIMGAIVADLSAQEMQEIASYYSMLPGSIDTAREDLVPLGQRLYRGGDAFERIPACSACHGPAGLGNANAGFPRLSGQHMPYVIAQLKAFRSGKRIDKQHQMMVTIAKKMNDEDIEAVASYISGLYF